MLEGKYEFIFFWYKANMNLLMRLVNYFILLQWIYFKRKYLIIILWYNVKFCDILVI